MIQSDSNIKNADPEPISYFSIAEEDELLEQNIDAFDEKMDNEYDDGIAQSNIDDQLETDEDEDMDDVEDNIRPFTYNDELEDYDLLEDEELEE
ncbi:hypothetical protein EXM22_07070 [Oceanispirochaeta crateris]|jgi:hypothetical protein|uniref:Uncharacterized protein n=1 Tax=Oceanispirochaeta crateris TaxID=2518645 RepID=A0A5C1QLC5_9SPIO|nr:hypothetical protein [Oceanispirochaeta crateris]QEN07760.1 hypothetical protein EXM22_07070 [Oceanispirochaeta crateris]